MLVGFGVMWTTGQQALAEIFANPQGAFFCAFIFIISLKRLLVAGSQTTPGHMKRAHRPQHLPLHVPNPSAGAQTAQPNLSAGGNKPLKF